MSESKTPQPYDEAIVLHVSLTNGTIKREPLDKDMIAKYLGGRGIGVKTLYDNLPPGVDPLSPDNLLIFAVGPVTATSVPTAGRSVVVTKSPLTGTVFDSNVGGHIGAYIRRAGYAAIVFEGRSEEPVYLWIDDDEVEIREAGKVWGENVEVSTDKLIEETDAKAHVACIGPAGENLVKLASIMTDKHRAYGRGGVGAVMGSKNLKALVVKGTGKVAVKDEEQLDLAVKRARRLIKKNPVTDKSLPVYGTPVLVNLANEYGMLPTHNFQEGTFNDAEGVSGEKLLERLSVRTYRCFGCPIGCGRISKTYGEEVGGPEYETIWALGPQCGINDLEWIAMANHHCNLLGMDTISVGSTIGCAMELVQRGKMDASLEFGNTEGLLELIDDMGHARGLGAELGEGSRTLAEKHGAPDLAMQVKGLEIPAYDPRGAQGHALGYATSNRGGCHLRSYLIGPEILGVPVRVDRDRPEGKADLVILYQNLSAAMDAFVLCRFTNFAFTVDDYAEFVSACTGIPIDGHSLLAIGERIWNLERMFNLREGIDGSEDKLPPRFNTPLPEGGTRNRVVLIDEMLPEYYRLRGWDAEGRPTKERLERLGLA
ncbi:MAG: aldehyde ferredoxin oxidoreductase family protein [Candidatus Thorarchaeota archaeon]|nr:MAG: aldehyde ferredoxin oxidoreductase family protein [Candidatus Thorarchaeota archaeon]